MHAQFPARPFFSQFIHLASKSLFADFFAHWFYHQKNTLPAKLFTTTSSLVYTAKRAVNKTLLINDLGQPKKQPAELPDFRGQKGEIVIHRRQLFMKCRANLRGQHINFYSRVIHSGNSSIKSSLRSAPAGMRLPKKSHRLLARLFRTNPHRVLN
jgi:hypothetical protein